MVYHLSFVVPRLKEVLAIKRIDYIHTPMHLKPPDLRPRLPLLCLLPIRLSIF
jgi:hypothetical protein